MSDSPSRLAARMTEAYLDRGHELNSQIKVGGGSPATPDGKFGMDGYAICGAVLGALYGGLNFGILGALGGAVVGAILVLVILGPFWLLHRAYKRLRHGPGN
jgi:hypothetical protein